MNAHEYTLRVYFEDTDAGGMAYHANHLRWAERARTEALRDLGLPHQRMIDAHNSLLVVRRVTVEYAVAARLDDSLVVETRIVAVGGATLTLDQRVLRGAERIATLDVRLACVDRATLKPCRIPEPWRTVLAARTTEGELPWTAA